MKKLLYILIATMFFSSYSQEEKKSKRYISLKEYYKKYKEKLTKQDSLNLIYLKGDTLVLITSNYIRPPGASVEYEYKDETFLNEYKKIAFKDKNNAITKSATTKYWKQNITIYFDKNIPKKTKNNFLTFSKNVINEIDSLKLKEVKKVEESNYIVYYSEGFEYESRMNNFKKSDFYMYWNQNKIYKSTMRINTFDLFNEKLRLNKMKSLFLRSLGLFNFNTDLSCNHYFSGCYMDNIQLSEFDKELLKYHYSYGICKGTDLETFEMQHKQAKEQLRDTGIKIKFFHPYN